MTGLTSGPWFGRTSPIDSTQWMLTLGDLRELLKATPDRAAMIAALNVEQLSDRKADRALQLLRQARLIAFRDGAWRRTELGCKELSR